jgi:hypothetical protein
VYVQPCGVKAEARYIDVWTKRLAILPAGVSLREFSTHLEPDLTILHKGVPFRSPLDGQTWTVKACFALYNADYPQLCSNVNHGGMKSEYNSPSSRRVKDQILDWKYDEADAEKDRNAAFVDAVAAQALAEFIYLLKEGWRDDGDVQEHAWEVRNTWRRKWIVIRQRYCIARWERIWFPNSLLDPCILGALKDFDHMFYHGLLCSLHNLAHLEIRALGKAEKVGFLSNVAESNAAVIEFRRRVYTTEWPTAVKTIWVKTTRSRMARASPWPCTDC